MDEVVHAPLVGFVGLFTIDIYETRDKCEGWFMCGKEVYSGVGVLMRVGVLKRVGVLMQFHYKENRGYLI
jgi:hypothetical protein